MDHIHLQKMPTGKWRVVTTSSNGKLVLAGESQNRKTDATKLRDEYSRKHDFMVGDDLGPRHQFARNAGPKKKK